MTPGPPPPVLLSFLTHLGEHHIAVHPGKIAATAFAGALLGASSELDAAHVSFHPGGEFTALALTADHEELLHRALPLYSATVDACAGVLACVESGGRGGARTEQAMFAQVVLRVLVRLIVWQTVGRAAGHPDAFASELAQIRERLPSYRQRLEEPQTPLIAEVKPFIAEVERLLGM
jgi:hypothetical protein